jgi:signal transduction histidine kinase
MIQIILALDISPTDERKEAYLRIVERETRRLSNLVEILLSISRLEAGRDVLHRSRFAVGELARIVKDSIRLPEDREVSISITGKDNPEAYADRRQIGLVIRNILENAVRYTPDGGVVEIIISRVRGRVIMGIKDQGPGIPPEQQELIFERFYRIREDRSTAGKGSGLGLSVAWEIIKAHNEKIWLESLPGQGSTFYFSLPESEETLHPAGTGHGHRQQAESGHE